MVRSIASKVMWVGRATVFMVGFAVIFALVLGAATMAFAANGDPWLLGQNNVATAITRLAGAAGVDGPMLRIINNNAGPDATAIDLQVEPGKPPMTVDSEALVTNLNADNLDGRDSSAFLGVGARAADADRLDGVDSFHYVRGGDGFAGMPPGGSTEFRISGVGEIELSCGNPARPAVRYQNLSNRDQRLFVDSGQADSTVELLPPNSRGGRVKGSATVGSADHITYLIGRGGGLKSVLVHLFAAVREDGSGCVFYTKELQ